MQTFGKQTNNKGVFTPFTRPAQYPSQKLPLSERWSARHFDLQTSISEGDDKELNDDKR